MIPFFTPDEGEEPVPHPRDLLGQRYRLTEEDHALASHFAMAHHMLSQDRGTRDAGADYLFRLKGSIGDVVVARMLGIEPQLRASSGPERLTPDIVWLGYLIEVKNGLPMEAKFKVQAHWWYVTVTDVPEHIPGVLRVPDPLTDLYLYATRSVTYGADVLARAEEPPERWCPRPGTRSQNWRLD